MQKTAHEIQKKGKCYWRVKQIFNQAGHLPFHHVGLTVFNLFSHMGKLIRKETIRKGRRKRCQVFVSHLRAGSPPKSEPAAEYRQHPKGLGVGRKTGGSNSWRNLDRPPQSRWYPSCPSELSPFWPSSPWRKAAIIHSVVSIVSKLIATHVREWVCACKFRFATRAKKLGPAKIRIKKKTLTIPCEV